MQKFTVTTLILGITFVHTQPALAADETKNAIVAPPVVISAARFITSIETAPVNITIISAEDIENSNATNLTQVLNYQAGINVSSLYGISGAYAKIDMGGFGENSVQNTLVLLNGRRLNDVDMDGVNLTGIPLDSVERIEIVRGSSAVLYGDNAASGVINIITKSAFAEEHASVKIMAGSYQTQKVNFSLRKRQGDTGFSLFLDNLESNGYRQNNDSKNTSLFGEINHENMGWNYGARLNFSREDTTLPGSLDETSYESNPKKANLQDNAFERRNSLEGFIENDIFIGELSVSNKHQEYISTGYDTESDLKTVSITPRFRQKLGSHSLVAGLDFYNSTLDTMAHPSEGEQNIKRKSYAIYVTDTLSFNPGTDLSLGARKQMVDVTIDNIDPFSSTDNSDNRKDDLASWDITLSHDHKYGARNYVRIARSFRMPTLDETFIYPAPAYSPVINLLDPQIGRHIEIGTRQKIGKNIELDANLFRIDLQDEIAFDINTFNNINLDKTRHDGLNINLNVNMNDHLIIQAGYSRRNAQFRNGPNKGSKIPLVPLNKMVLSGLYKFDGKSNIGVNAVYTGERYYANDDANDGKKLAGYTRTDLSYTREFADWKVHLLAQNIANNQAADFALYRSGSYFYYPLPERALYLTLEGEM